ncbi:hypothetical protein [Actinoplanes sp. NPDC048796]|uniref:hypothetical protein n=1 Tax=unclassified Actinoplanes TaxID=2626549 RepID=UPI0033D70AA4
MSHVFGIELRRSAALGSALALAVVGILLLVLDAGAGFGTGWMQLAMTQRLFLAVLWPLALAAGAWQGRREHRTRVGELLASTPRPAAQRVLPTLGAMAVGVVAGYLLMGVAGGLWIARSAEYFPARFFVVTAVGGLALVAAVWAGVAVGRLLPWRGVAPALGLAGLGLLLTIPAMTRPRGWLALVFSPIYEMNMPGSYADVPSRVSGAQAVWLAALAGAAVVLLTSTGWRARTAALLPLAAGAVLAIVVMPHQNRIVTDAVDPVAQELVCTDGTPRVCVARVHAGRIDDVAGPAREGLKVLAKLPGAPTGVNENTTTYRAETYPEFRADTVLISVGAGEDRAEVFDDVVSGAFDGPPACENGPAPAERLAAAHWLLGTKPAIDGYEADYLGEAVRLWQGLRQLPETEAVARVQAVRQAAVTCTAAEGLLTGGRQ